MKVGLLADIHANVTALAAVLGKAEAMGAEHLLVAGDLIDYYFAPAETLALLAPWPRSVVRGNHEEMLAKARHDPWYLDRAEKRRGSGLRLALEELSGAEIDMLVSLPHPLRITFGGCRILLCHGTPDDLDRYVYPDADTTALAACVWPEVDLVVTGHTHYPMKRHFRNIPIVNPGSVGQPRNRRPGAAWALFDTESGEVSFHIEAYDHEAVAREARARHPELPYLSDALLRTGDRS